MIKSYPDRINEFQKAFEQSDFLLVGSGAGLSTSDGLQYGGKRFEENFPEYIKKYKLTDMYSSAFYPFETSEERWGYWSRHILLNRYTYQPGQVYKNLFDLLRSKDHFVITTNGDALFEKTGFDLERIFSVQGDYAKFQCTKACHDTLYDNEEQIRQMVLETKNLKVPREMIPTCPVCGEEMDANLRRDQFFVEDQAWHQSAERYQEFLFSISSKPTLLLELGVGYNTPSIIKYPFEEITANHDQARLIRINKDYPEISQKNAAKTISFSEDIGMVLNDITLSFLAKN